MLTAHHNVLFGSGASSAKHTSSSNFQFTVDFAPLLLPQITFGFRFYHFCTLPSITGHVSGKTDRHFPFCWLYDANNVFDLS